MDSVKSSTDIFFGLIGLSVEHLRKHKRLRRNILISILVLILIVGGTRIFVEQIFSNAIQLEIIAVLEGGLVILGILLIITTISYTSIEFKFGGINVDLDKIRQEREEIKKRITTQEEDDVFNTIQLSLNQLSEYYAINLNQARSSYRWSIAAIVVGILTLLGGVWLLFLDDQSNVTLAVISGVSGTIIEFIGASNIYIYNKSLKQLNLYFKELINIQDTMLAIELCEKISDDSRKTDIKEKIILSLMGRSSVRPELAEGFRNKKKSN